MTYSDIVKMGLILPKKNTYTITDYETLVNYGYVPKVARFICICSAVYCGTSYAKAFDTLKFRLQCNIA